MHTWRHVSHPARTETDSHYNIDMDTLVIAGKAFQSRLIVGTGKYKDGAETQRAIEASGAEMVTVAVRRVNLDRSKESLLDFIDPQRYFLDVAKVGLNPGADFGPGYERFVRLNFGCPRSLLEEGIARLQASLERR